MIFGDQSVFAIESEITQAYERQSFLALGLFVIHVRGFRYGVFEPDATLLACSLGEVEQRIANRGSHVIPAIQNMDARRIAEAIRSAIYFDVACDSYLGIPTEEFVALVYSSRVMWAPDGDEAFDDGSCVLQFDIGETVRVIAFRSSEHAPGVDTSTLTDVQLPADQFYERLSDWRNALLAAWECAPKISLD